MTPRSLLLGILCTFQLFITPAFAQGSHGTAFAFRPNVVAGGSENFAFKPSVYDSGNGDDGAPIGSTLLPNKSSLILFRKSHNQSIEVRRLDIEGRPEHKGAFDVQGYAVLPADFESISHTNRRFMPQAIATLPEGGFVVAGQIIREGPLGTRLGMVAFDSAGNLDRSFGRSGYVSLDIPNERHPEFHGLYVKGNAIYLTGGAHDQIMYNVSVPLVAKVSVNGKLDPHFGIRVFKNSHMVRITSLDVDSKGRAHLVGLHSDRWGTPDGSLRILRLRTSGRREKSVTVKPHLGTDPKLVCHQTPQIVLDQTDYLYLSSTSCERYLYLGRLNSRLRKDKSFGVDGEIRGPWKFSPKKIFLQPKTDKIPAKILVVGNSNDNDSVAAGMVRYLLDGTPDPDLDLDHSTLESRVHFDHHGCKTGELIEATYSPPKIVQPQAIRVLFRANCDKKRKAVLKSYFLETEY